MRSGTKKRRFTLLELLVCIAILGVIASLLGIKGKGMVDHHRFRSSVQEVANKLGLCKTLALSYQADLTFRLFEKEGALYFQIISDEPLIQKKIPKKPIKLPGVDTATPVTLAIPPSGWINPQVLEFHHKDQTLRINTP